MKNLVWKPSNSSGSRGRRGVDPSCHGHRRFGIAFIVRHETQRKDSGNGSDQLGVARMRPTTARKVRIVKAKVRGVALYGVEQSVVLDAVGGSSGRARSPAWSFCATDLHGVDVKAEITRRLPLTPQVVSPLIMKPSVSPANTSVTKEFGTQKGQNNSEGISRVGENVPTIVR